MAQPASPNTDTNDELVSKTQIKKEMHDLQELGLHISKLGKKQLATLPLSENMLDAIELASKIRNKHEAYKRHVQYMGKVLREEDLEGINKALELLSNKHQQQDKKFERYESLRDKLIAEGNTAIEELLSEYPNLERQKLRQLCRQAKKEVAQEKPGKSYSALFSYLKQHVQY